MQQDEKKYNQKMLIFYNVFCISSNTAWSWLNKYVENVDERNSVISAATTR